MAASFLVCIAFVSGFYHLPPRVLPSIAVVEGGRPGLVSGNTDGSADLGIMQINTRWVAPLALHAGQPEAIVRRRLIDEPCFNIAMAGAIMRIYLNEENGDLARAVGDYHSHTPWRNLSYQLKIVGAARWLFGAHVPQAAPGAAIAAGPPPGSSVGAAGATRR